MSGMVDFNLYSTILFMDSMVALEGKPLPTLPWNEIDPAGPILVLVVPQVMKEIDKRKRDGRLAKRAREFNRLISPVAQSATAARIAAGPPAVDIAMAVCERIQWEAFDDLDDNEGDDRVVAQILHARGIPSDRKLLFSYDNNPIAIAARYKIKSRKMPDHWLLEPEPSPYEKENQKLKARVQVLESQEPEIDIVLTFETAPPLQVYKILPLSVDQQTDLVRRIFDKNPENDRSDLFGFSHDYSYSGRYENYRNKIIPRYVKELHNHLEADYGQVPFNLTVVNSGRVQAENLVVTLRALSGGLHNKYVYYPVFGPSAPQPRNSLMTPFIRPNFLGIKQTVGRHEIEFAVGPDGGNTIEIHCADFRHGREWSFAGIARIDPHSSSPFKIQAGGTASNLRGAIEREFEYAFQATSVEASELIDYEDGSHRIVSPLMQKIQEATNFDWLEVHQQDYNDD